MIRFTPAHVRAYLDDDDVPHSIACAIHGRLVRQPVHAPDMPQIYEASALNDWLQRNSTNPFSRAPLQARTVLPAPHAHEAANRFRRLVNAECQRRAAVPELSPVAAQELRATGAMHLCVRYRNTMPRVPSSLVIGVDELSPVARRYLAARLALVGGPVRPLYLARARAWELLSQARGVGVWERIEERRARLIWPHGEQEWSSAVSDPAARLAYRAMSDRER